MNGKTEKLNGMLLDATRATLASPGLSQSLMVKTITVVYLRNRLPQASLNDDVSYTK